SLAFSSHARMFLRPRGSDHVLVVPSGTPPRFVALLLGLFFSALWTASMRFWSALAEEWKCLAISSRLANLVLCLVGSYLNSCFFSAALRFSCSAEFCLTRPRRCSPGSWRRL